MKSAIGFLGLGRLGFPIAANLVAADYAVHVFNRTAEKAAPLVAKGATLAPRAVDALTPGGVVASVLWDDAALEEVVTRDGFLERLGAGGLHISMGTIPPERARAIAAMHEKHGVSYVEAPIFGRPEAAVAKQLWVPIAGKKEAKDRARPFIEAMGARGIFDFGEQVGAATMVKLAGNFMIISAARTMAEAVATAEKNGVDPKALVDMLTTTLFDVPLYRGFGQTILAKAPVMQSNIPLKDVGIFVRVASEAGVPSPIAARVLEMLKPAS